MDMRTFNSVNSVLCTLALLSPLAYGQILVEPAFDTDPGSTLESFNAESSILDMLAREQSSDKPPQLFLINRDRSAWGFPFLATDSQLQDLGVAAVDGNLYWDWYGNGIFYIASPIPGNPGQIWHVNTATKVRTQITDGTCIFDAITLSVFSEAPLCGFLGPVSASPYGDVAFIQEVLNPEQPNRHLVISRGGEAAVVDSEIGIKPESLTWSEDGEWLLYWADLDSSQQHGLRATNLDGTLHCDFPGVDPFPFQYVDWSGRNGGEIVYASQGNLWLVPLTPPRKRGACPKMDLRKKIQLTATDDDDSRPQWLGVVDLIAFTSNRPAPNSLMAPTCGRSIPQHWLSPRFPICHS